jgi:outer membrane protein OmpA-like peptidoglycan-associated protein
MPTRFLPRLLAIAILLASCNTIRMQRADRAYDLMQYPKAEGLYERILRNKDDRTARARLAASYLRHNALEEAVRHYKHLDSSHHLIGDTGVHYAKALMGLGRTQEATDVFFRVLQDQPENRLAQDLFESAQGYQSFFQDSSRYIINRLTIPGVQAAFAPVPYQNGLLLAAVPEKSTQEDPWSGMSYLDLVQTTKRTVVTWTPAAPLPGAVNGTFHEGSAAISADGNTLYFTRSNYVERKLMKDDGNTSHLMLFRATKDSTGNWGDLRAFAYNSERWSTGHPALSADGRTLYFASDRPGGFGGMDIWRCRDLGTGWSDPENLGSVVNTPGNELFPTINGDALHFSSSGHFNMGGLDILETREQDGAWSTPRNLGYPVNTVHDDMHFVLDSSQVAGFLSSDRSGIDQVYAFSIHEPLFYLDGLAVDDEGGFLPNTQVVLDLLDSDDDITLTTDANGRFGTQLARNSEYILKATRPDMLTASTTVSTKGLIQSDTLNLSVRMERIRVGEAIAIQNIYYDYDKWDIRTDAAKELDRIARIFTENPGLTFELSSHTDSRGSDTYNLVLSDARANSAVNYLIRQGVDPERITAKGYGERVPFNKCRNGVRCTEEDHQANRRTEFKVTGSIELVSQP